MYQISTKEAQSRREIARLLERLRVQTADHLQENEDSIKVCTRRFESETRTRDEEINALNGEIVQLRVKLVQALGLKGFEVIYWLIHDYLHHCRNQWPGIKKSPRQTLAMHYVCPKKRLMALRCLQFDLDSPGED